MVNKWSLNLKIWKSINQIDTNLKVDTNLFPEIRNFLKLTHLLGTKLKIYDFINHKIQMYI